jgi:hypothetical protein
MPNRAAYKKRMRALLTARERALFARLDTPQKIQRYLDQLPVNFETDGEGTMSPRRTIAARKAHCADGALLAAAALAFHGRPAWLMDFQTLPVDEDHIVAVFKERGLWGAISKTNHAVLRWRDPIYRTPRELAMSFAHEYYLWGGRRSLLAFSRPFDCARYAPQRWVTAEEDLEWLMQALDHSPHQRVAPKSALKKRLPAAKVELRTLAIVEWRDPRKRKRGS